MLHESKMTYLLISGAKQRSITGNTDTENRSVLLRYQLMSTYTLTQVPDTDHTGVVATDELALVGMDDHIVDCSTVNIIPLRVSQTFTVPSSELVTIHFPSQWNATPVMLFV